MAGPPTSLSEPVPPSRVEVIECGTLWPIVSSSSPAPSDGFDRVDLAGAGDRAAAGAVGVGRVAVGDVGAADRVLAAGVVDRALVGAGAAGEDQRRLAVDRLVDFDREAVGAGRRAAGGFFGEAAGALVAAGAAEGRRRRSPPPRGGRCPGRRRAGSVREEPISVSLPEPPIASSIPFRCSFSAPLTVCVGEVDRDARRRCPRSRRCRVRRGRRRSCRCRCCR